MDKVIEGGRGQYTRDNLKATIQINGKDSCLDELIKTLGVRDKYIFTIRTNITTHTVTYLESLSIDYKFIHLNKLSFDLIVRDDMDGLYWVNSIEIEENKSTLLQVIQFPCQYKASETLIKYVGSNDYKYILHTDTGEEIECSYITEAEIKFTPDDATGVNQQKLLIHTEYDNWYTVNKVEVHKVEKWVD